MNIPVLYNGDRKLIPHKGFFFFFPNPLIKTPQPCQQPTELFPSPNGAFLQSHFLESLP